MLHAACDGPVIVWTQTVWTSWKNNPSGNGNGLNWSERREKHHFFTSKRNKEQARHVLVGTIYFPLMLVAVRNLVELVRSRRRLGGVSHTPVEGPISFNGGRGRRFLVEQKVDVCFLLRRDSLVQVSTAKRRRHTGSRQITEVKHRRAGLVPGWVTTREHPVL